ncbi:MAG: hypothetical protein KA253_03230 [Campylobacteraceae bacterium]|nr:hypothetical protein [Campylobacteraceae bacterium]
MMCTDFNPMIVIWGFIMMVWIILMSSSYRKHRDAKEKLMLEEVMNEFNRLLAKEKRDGN